MAYIMDMFRRVFKLRQPKPTNIEQRVTWLLHPYINKVHDILLWNNPMVSAWCLFAVNVLFWLLRTIHVRPLAIVAGALMLAVGLDGIATALGAGKRSYSECKDSQNGNPGRLNEAFGTIQRQFVKLRTLSRKCRDENPIKYCVSVISGFVLLMMIGDFLGALFMHGVVTLVFLSPLTPNLINKVNDIKSQPDSDHDDEEFLPELTNKVLEELKRAGEVQESMESRVSATNLSLPDDIVDPWSDNEPGSSDDDNIYTQTNEEGLNKVASLSLTDSDDSDEEFIPRGFGKNLKSASPDVTDLPKIVESADMSWFSSLIPETFRPHMVTSDTDDDFEIIDKSEITSNNP